MPIDTLPAKALVFVLSGATFAILANMLVLIMIGELNRKLPEDQQISYVFWGIGDLKRRYRQFYPTSKHIFLLRICQLLMIASFLAAFWCMGLLPI